MSRSSDMRSEALTEHTELNLRPSMQSRSIQRRRG